RRCHHVSRITHHERSGSLIVAPRRLMNRIDGNVMLFWPWVMKFWRMPYAAMDRPNAIWSSVVSTGESRIVVPRRVCLTSIDGCLTLAGQTDARRRGPGVG